MPIHRLLAALLLFTPGAGADDLESPRAQFERVARRVRRWQPTAEERRFDAIGWAADLREAIRLAGQLGRPVFLSTHDGHMNVGRC